MKEPRNESGLFLARIGCFIRIPWDCACTFASRQVPMTTRRSSAAGSKPKAAKPKTQKRGSSSVEQLPTANATAAARQRRQVAGSNPAPAAKQDANARTKGSDGLTDQQRLFVAEYLKDNNATKAAARAGYAPETARQQGSRLLTNVVIRDLVNSHQAETLAKVQHDTGITLERTLREIARIAYFDPRRMFAKDGRPLSITELDDDTAAVIAGLEVLEEFAGSGEDRVMVGLVKKWKLADKKGGLDMLMKHLGGYKVDNDQKKPELSEALAGFLGQLHESSAGRLPIAPQKPRKP